MKPVVVGSIPVQPAARRVLVGGTLTLPTLWRTVMARVSRPRPCSAVLVWVAEVSPSQCGGVDRDDGSRPPARGAASGAEHKDLQVSVGGRGQLATDHHDAGDSGGFSLEREGDQCPDGCTVGAGTGRTIGRAPGVAWWFNLATDKNRSCADASGKGVTQWH